MLCKDCKYFVKQGYTPDKYFEYGICKIKKINVCGNDICVSKEAQKV